MSRIITVVAEANRHVHIAVSEQTGRLQVYPCCSVRDRDLAWKQAECAQKLQEHCAYSMHP